MPSLNPYVYAQPLKINQSCTLANSRRQILQDVMSAKLERGFYGGRASRLIKSEKLNLTFWMFDIPRCFSASHFDLYQSNCTSSLAPPAPMSLFHGQVTPQTRSCSEKFSAAVTCETISKTVNRIFSRILPV